MHVLLSGIINDVARAFVMSRAVATTTMYCGDDVQEHCTDAFVTPRDCYHATSGTLKYEIPRPSLFADAKNRQVLIFLISIRAHISMALVLICCFSSLHSAVSSRRLNSVNVYVLYSMLYWDRIFSHCGCSSFFIFIYNFRVPTRYRAYRVAQKSKPLSRIIIKSY